MKLFLAMIVLAAGCGIDGGRGTNGTTVVLEPVGDASPVRLAAAVETTKRRLRGLDVDDPDVRLDTRGAGGLIRVVVPERLSVSDTVATLTRPGRLEFREVLETMPVRDLGGGGSPNPELTRQIEAEGLFVDRKGAKTYRLGPSELGDDPVRDAFASFDDVSNWSVQVEFEPDATKAFAAVTRRLAAGQSLLAIVLDRIVESAPQVQQPIEDGRAQISGTFTEREARELAVVLESGSLAVDLRVARG